MNSYEDKSQVQGVYWEFLKVMESEIKDNSKEA